jgi:hypothetical protein
MFTECSLTESLPAGARALPKGAKDRVTIDVLQPSGGALFPLGARRTRGRLLFHVDPVRDIQINEYELIIIIIIIIKQAYADKLMPVRLKRMET